MKNKFVFARPAKTAETFFDDELLLQEDSYVSGGLENEFSKEMHLNQALGPTETLIEAKRVSGTLNTSSNMTMQRPSTQVFTCGEGSSSSSLDPHGGYMHHTTKPPHFLPHFQQNSPSRFGQQPGQQFDFGRSTSVHGAEWNHLKVLAPLPSFSYGVPDPLVAAPYLGGMDLYFKRHDGQAVTCEDFFAAMRDANNANFSNLLIWYSQAGTPIVKVSSKYNIEAGTFSLKFRT